jgi:formylglycine-generating enzyme required for sulfatase activity
MSLTLPTAALRIENPRRISLSLHRVDSDWKDTLGSPSELQRVLPEGAYWVQAGRLKYPVPLLRAVRTDGPFVLRIEEAPAEEEAWSYIPAGLSLQGDTLGIGQEDERPAHLAWISGFWMSRREVTNEEYCEFLNASELLDPTWLNLESRKCMIRRGPGGFVAASPRLPVVTVSWIGAKSYADWLTRKTGRLHRLPTEAEWEKAARGPESFVYSYGNVYTSRCANQESGRLEEVGRFAPNGFGLFDMTGNAFEWVADGYDREAYARRERRDPCVPAEREYHLLRGGSFVLDGVYLRNSFRMRYRPTVQADDIGFRLVRP